LLLWLPLWVLLLLLHLTSKKLLQCCQQVGVHLGSWRGWHECR